MDPRVEILHAIAKAALCGDCLAHKADVTRSVVEEEITRMREVFVITTSYDSCEGCTQVSVVYRLG